MNGEWIRNVRSDTSVVFVHGILAKENKSWRHVNGTYWPELLAQEKELEGLNIYVFRYRTGIFSGTYQLGDVVDALKERMRLDGLLDSKRLVFVCHSMGGIVVRRFIVVRQMDFKERQTQIGLFLVASPSLGSSYANLLTGLGRALGISNAQAEALRFEQDNAWLNDLDKDFINLKETGALAIKGKELIEHNFIVIKDWWHKQVVEPFSGARYFGESFKVENSDHSSIATPENGKAIQHELLCQFIREMFAEPIAIIQSKKPYDGGHLTSEADWADKERCYRNALIERFQCLPLPDVFGGGIDLSTLDLAHLFVRLKLRRPPTVRIPDPPPELREELTTDQLAIFPDLTTGRASIDDLGAIQPEVVALVKHWLDEVLDPPVVDFAEALHKSRYVAVTGGGGSGKTTLTRWLTLVCSQNCHADPGCLGPLFTGRLLPVWVDLKGFATWIATPEAGLQGRALEQVVVAYVTRLEAPGPGRDASPMLLDAFRRGEAIVLFDGLDEIVDRARREQVINIVRNMTVGDNAKGYRIVVTSRPYACSVGTLGSAFTYGDIEPFELTEMSSYLVDHWYPTAYGKAFDREARQLVGQIKADPHLREIAVNPLLCTLLAVLYRKGHRPLPTRRTEIYEQCTALLLHIWDEGKGVGWPLECSEETRLALVAALAYETLKTAPFLVLPKMVARDTATTFLQDQFGFTPNDASQSADSLLLAIEDRAGLIETHNAGNLQFLLRPFLDYLAARHLADIPVEDVLVNEIMPHLFDGNWRSVILLTVARLPGVTDGRKRLSTLLRTMASAMPAPPKLPIRMLARLRVWRDCWLESQLLRTDCMLAEALREVGGQVEPTVSCDVLPSLENRLCIAFRQGLMERRELAANALVDIVSMSQSARAMLSAALQDQDQSIRRIAALALARRAGSESAARDELLKASLSDDHDVGASATNAVWPILADNYPDLNHAQKRRIMRNHLCGNSRFEDKTMGMFVDTATHANEVLEDIAWFKGLGGSNSTHRNNLLHIYMNWLGERAWQIPDILEALATSLSDSDRHVRNEAAMSLSRSNVCVQGVIDALSKALDDEDHYVRDCSAWALAKRASVEPKAMTVLFDAFKNRESSTRMDIVPALALLAEDVPVALDVLREGLDDPSFDIRYYIAQHLKPKAGLTNECLAVFRDGLKGSSRYTRHSFVHSIAKLAEFNEAAFDDLRSAIDDPDSDVRFAAIEGLMQFPRSLQEGVAAHKRMLTDPDPKTRLAAIMKLAALPLPDGLTTEEVVSILTQDEGLWDNSSTSWDLVTKMPKYGPLGRQLIETRLLHGGNRQRYNLLHTIGECKSEPLLADPFADVLSVVLQDKDWNIRHMAARALKRVQHPSPRLITAICNELGRFYLRRWWQPSHWNTKAAEALVVAAQRVDLSDSGMPEAINALFNHLRKGWSFAVVDSVRTLIARGHEPALVLIPDVVRLALRGQAAALRVLALDPKAQNQQVYDHYVDIVALGLRSRSPEVRKAAFTTLGQLTNGRALPSFNWAKRNYSKAMYAWLFRIAGTVIGALVLATFIIRFATDSVITGVATILGTFLGLLSVYFTRDKILEFLKQPPRLR